MQLWGAIEAVWKSWTLKKAVDYRTRERHLRDARHRRQRRVDGVRQPRRRFGHRRRVHAQSVDRREEVLRRVSRQRAGRGRRRRHSHAARASTRWPSGFPARTRSCSRRRSGSSGTTATCRTSSSPSSAASCICCRRAPASAPRPPPCASRRDMVDEGLIDTREAVLRVPPEQLDQLLHPVIDPAVRATPLCIGLPGESGRGERRRGVRSRRRRAARRRRRERHSRARRDDAGGFSRHRRRARGAHGARRHDEPRRRRRARHGQVRGRRLQGHSRRSRAPRASASNGIDGRRRRLDHARRRDRARVRGDLPTIAERGRAGHPRNARSRRSAPLYQAFAELLGWADEVRTLRVRANADTPHDARIARGFGAEGIGLCRTEHMFFEGDRITAMREMIVARDEGGRRRALAKLLPMQRADFEGIFEAMDGLPGHDPAARSAAARVPAARRRGEQAARAHARHAARRARLASSSRCARPTRCSAIAAAGWASPIPEITEMQGRAIFEAAVRAKRRGHRRPS